MHFVRLLFMATQQWIVWARCVWKISIFHNSWHSIGEINIDRLSCIIGWSPFVVRAPRSQSTCNIHMFYFPYSFWLRNVCRANSLQKQTLESWPHELTNNNNKKERRTDCDQSRELNGNTNKSVEFNNNFACWYSPWFTINESISKEIYCAQYFRYAKRTIKFNEWNTN